MYCSVLVNKLVLLWWGKTVSTVKEGHESFTPTPTPTHSHTPTLSLTPTPPLGASKQPDLKVVSLSFYSGFSKPGGLPTPGC